MRRRTAISFFIFLLLARGTGQDSSLRAEVSEEERAKQQLFLHAREEMREDGPPESTGHSLVASGTAIPLEEPAPPVIRAVPVERASRPVSVAQTAQMTPPDSGTPPPRAVPVNRDESKTEYLTPSESPVPTPATTPPPTMRPASTPVPPIRAAIVIKQPVNEEERRQPPKPQRKSSGDDDDDKRPGSDVVVSKSGAESEEGNEPPPVSFFGPKWKYVTPAIRKAIDQAPVKRNRWKFIVVHNSSTRQGNAKIFDRYHRYERKMPNGLAYHFVIGNGSSTGDGQIEIGNRWTRQINGGHVASDYLNNIALGICLVGDFDKDLPSKQQLESLDELIRYLRRRVGRVNGKESIVKGHREINPRPTSCPGDRFPLRWLHGRFG